MTENEQKQQFSIAYVHAVAARAGFTCQATLVDDDSVDVVIGGRGWVHQQAQVRSPRIEVQLKATAQEVLGADAVAFPLPVKNYDELRLPSAVPRILVVLRLPSTLSQWLEQSEDQLLCRHAAYWVSLSGRPATMNTASITVTLPREQMLTADSIRGLMERVARKEPL
jgi:hypothetical protein